MKTSVPSAVCRDGASFLPMWSYVTPWSPYQWALTLTPQARKLRHRGWANGPQTSQLLGEGAPFFRTALPLLLFLIIKTPRICKNTGKTDNTKAIKSTHHFSTRGPGCRACVCADKQAGLVLQIWNPPPGLSPCAHLALSLLGTMTPWSFNQAPLWDLRLVHVVTAVSKAWLLLGSSPGPCPAIAQHAFPERTCRPPVFRLLMFSSSLGSGQQCAHTHPQRRECLSPHP